MILLIASGAYITQELASEFGQIPPSFMPVGNKRLLEWQLALNDGQFAQVFITLPENFIPDASDVALLSKYHVKVIPVDATWSLGQSIGYAIQKIAVDAPLSLLYGDTLISRWPAAANVDWIGVGQSNDNYEWHFESTSANGNLVWIGAFHFLRPESLRHSINQTSDFMAAVAHYAGSHVAEKIAVAGWLDFGHVHTYYKSRTQITTQRSFNELKITDGVVHKQSNDQIKMKAESDWLEFAPAAIKKYLPAHYGNIKVSGEIKGYSSEYLAYPSLADLYVFGRLPASTWGVILHSCKKFVEAIAALPIEAFDSLTYNRQIYADKTRNRLTQFADNSGIDLSRPWRLNGQPVPALTAMAEDCIAYVLQSHSRHPSLVHGDFCFSNVLYDFRSARIKAIDPRGMNASGDISPYGDLRYEISKLGHSIIGLYDFIVADRFFLDTNGSDISFFIDAPHVLGVQEIFSSIPFCGKIPDEWDSQPIMVLLFLSMLPLHGDSSRRQVGLMANAMRLYIQWKNQDQ